MSEKKFYTSGNVAKMYGVTITTVLNWQEKGILIPDKILKSGHRRYSEELIKKFDEELKIKNN